MKKLLIALLALALLCIAPAALALDVPASESEVPALPAAYTETAEKYETPVADLFKSLEPGEGTEYRIILSRKPELPEGATVEVYLEVLASGGGYRAASDSVTDNGWELVYTPSSAYAPDEVGALIRYTFPSIAADGKTLEAIDQYACEHTGALRVHEVFFSDYAQTPTFCMNYYFDADSRLTAYQEGDSLNNYMAYYKDGALQYADAVFSTKTSEDSSTSSTLRLSFDSEGLPLDKDAPGRKVEPVTDEAGNEIGKLIVHFSDNRDVSDVYFVRNDEPDVVYLLAMYQDSWRKCDLANLIETSGVSPAGAPADPRSVKAPLVLGKLPADAAEVTLPSNIQSVIAQYGFSDGIVKGVEDLGDNLYRIHFNKKLSSYMVPNFTSQMATEVRLYINGRLNWHSVNSTDFVEEDGGCYYDIPVSEDDAMINYLKRLEPDDERVYTVGLGLWYYTFAGSSDLTVEVSDMFTADGRLIYREVNDEYEYGDENDLYGENEGLPLTAYSNGNLRGSYDPETGKLESVDFTVYFNDEDQPDSRSALFMTRSADGTDARYEIYDSDYLNLFWDSAQKAWVTEDGEPYAVEFPEEMPANPEEIDLGVTF